MTKGMYITIRMDSDPGPLVTEHFRYMGLVQIGGLTHTGWPPYSIVNQLGQPAEGCLITVKCPHSSREVDQHAWARQQRQRMASFGCKTLAFEVKRDGGEAVQVFQNIVEVA